jgi:hypothetical protein
LRSVTQLGIGIGIGIGIGCFAPEDRSIER